MALTQVKTNAIADDAVTQDKVANDAIGLPEIKAGTDGQVLTFDASGNPAYVGPGTDGQVLTSAGAGEPPVFEDAVSEGTQVKSTGESGGTKFLREDGDGTSSWQAIPPGVTLSGSTDNTVCTVTGANAIQGESKLTFDGSVLRLENTAAAGDGVIYLEAGEGGSSVIEMVADEGDGDADKFRILVGDGGPLKIQNKAGGSYETNIECYGNGAVKLYKDNTLMCETSNDGLKFPDGKGIDFSATSDATGKSNELFDDYEEGTWTPSPDGLSNTPTYHNLVGKYTKIGNCVKVQGFIQTNASPTFTDTQLVFKVSGLPFASNGVGYLVCIGNVAWQGITWVGASHSTYGHADDTIIQAGIVNSTKTSFRTMGQADYYMGELKNSVFHDNGWILEWDMSYYV